MTLLLSALPTWAIISLSVAGGIIGLILMAVLLLFVVRLIHIEQNRRLSKLKVKADETRAERQEAGEPYNIHDCDSVTVFPPEENGFDYKKAIKLTVEEVQALEVGGYVWAESLSSKAGAKYVKITSNDNEFFSHTYRTRLWKYSDYGKKWVAYKMPEATSDTMSTEEEKSITQEDVDTIKEYLKDEKEKLRIGEITLRKIERLKKEIEDQKATSEVADADSESPDDFE